MGGCLGSPIVQSTLDGYNGSIIAYGQTGTGKTHTMEGGTADAAKGIIPRAADEIFRAISDTPGSHKCLVRISFLQIYNEKIADLLDPDSINKLKRNEDNKSYLAVRENPGGDVYVEGLSEHIVRSPAEIMGLLARGQKMRTTASTKMNRTSSRSHAVFIVIVERSTVSDDGKADEVTVGRLNLVDLAGSERVKSTGVEDATRMDEAKMINSSLTAFGKVILALTSAGNTHVPYRDSKLTRILQASLGGNCKTTLITAASSGSKSYAETLSTLKFSNRAKKVKNYAMVNKDQSDAALLTSYQKEISKLREQLKTARGPRSPAASEDEVSALRRRNSMLQVESAERARELSEEKEALRRRVAEMEQQLVSVESSTKVQTRLVEVSTLEPSSEEDLRAAETTLDATISAMIEADSTGKAAEILTLERSLIAAYQAKLAKLEAENADLRQDAEDYAAQKEQLELRSEDLDARSADLENQRRAFVAVKIKFTEEAAKKQVAAAIGDEAATQPVPPEPVAAQLPSDPPVAEAAPPPEPEAAADEPKKRKKKKRQDPAEYAAQLRDPVHGIPTQDFEHAGRTIVGVFSGAVALEYFQGNMHGITTPLDAKKVGQKLLELGIISSVGGKKKFGATATDLFRVCPDGAAVVPMRSGTSIQEAKLPWMIVEEEVQDPSRMTPLQAASAEGSPQKVRRASMDREIDEMDEIGRSALMHACIKNQVEAVETLLELGANACHQDVNGRTAVSWAAYYGHLDVLKVLVRQAREAVGIPDRDGRSPFHWCSKNSPPGCMDVLLEHATPELLDMQDCDGATALHWSVLCQRLGHCKRLLKAGASLQPGDEQGRTAVHYAVTNLADDCLKALIKSPDCPINSPDAAGRTALHLAINRDCSAEIVTILLQHPGVALNATDFRGTTPAHWAAVSNRADIIRMLWYRGAELRYRDNEGMTPLHYADQRSFEECIAVLVELQDRFPEGESQRSPSRSGRRTSEGSPMKGKFKKAAEMAIAANKAARAARAGELGTARTRLKSDASAHSGEPPSPGRGRDDEQPKSSACVVQ